MEKKQAITLIEDTFNAKFNEMQFTRFIGELLNDVEPKSNRYSGQMLWDDYKEHINSYKRIGKYTDPEGEPLDVLIVEVKTIAKLERARTSLRNFVIKHLSKFDKDYALVAFYAKEDDGTDWRFSFIKLEHQSYFDEEKDKVKIKKEFTPAKRYSFLVGEYEHSHTAKNQLLPLLQNLANNPTVEDLENAFSIEKVTDEFFSQYKDLFTKLAAHFAKDEHIKSELNKANINNARFTKKLLGQIVFLYFLQKKGWLGVPKNEKWGNGEKRFIQNLFDKSEKENYFKDYLQPLFYEALAKERSNEHSFYKRFNCRIPFLNGGLFEAEYKWETANITIPENLFRNQEKNKAGDIGTGVLDVFDRYNFTIKEDEPLDKEVAVDPEMLGKVFENMLEITERKSKGAFYTPREIVHYMCQESLIHYLDNALEGKVKKQDIETYIRKGHNALENDQRVAKKGEETATYKYILPKSIRENADLIDQKLTEIKICDPAIGSGAFPVGLLHELVNAQLVIKPHFSEKYIKEKLKEFGFSKKEQPSESRYIYRLKRHIIQESIYGVDIDASAIDIARLRLWLSLVVDEDDFDPIETLPNLDYKIVCGNSLISRYDLEMPIDNVFKEFNKKVQSKDYQNKAIKNLVGTKEIDLAYYKKLTNDFLLEADHEKKDLFRELISEIKNAFTTTLGGKALTELSKARGTVENLKQSDIFGNQVGTKTQISKAKKLLVKLEKEKQETQEGVLYKNAVEWRFEFPNLLDEDGNFVGFDVVIGNPPYVNIYSIDIKQKGIFKSLFNTAHKKYDLYVLFFEKSISLLKKKGSVNLITSNKYFSQPYGFKLRELFLKNRIIEIVNFRFNIFSATVDTAITHLSKDSSLDNIQILDVKDKNGYNHFTTHSNRVKLNLDFIKSLDEFLFRVEVSEVDIRIINMIKKISYKFSDICYINYGCRLVSKNGDKKKSDYIYTDNEQGIYKKFIEGRDIRKFEIISHKYVDYRPKEHYLSLFTELFDNAKLVSKDVVGKDGITVAFDSYGFYDDHTTINAVKWSELKNITYSGVLRNISKTNIELSEKFNYYELLGFINSEISNYYFNKLYNLDLHFYPGTFQNMIIPKNRFNNYSVIIEYILEAKKNNLDIIIKTFFESVSNAIVYELYFKQELKQAGKQVLKHLQDLKPINDTMREEEKLAIIQSEFERLYHPEHPVRFAVETLDSIEEVRIIKEALK